MKRTDTGRECGHCNAVAEAEAARVIRERRHLEQPHRERIASQPAAPQTEPKRTRPAGKPTADELVLALMLDFAATREQVVDWIVCTAGELL